MPHAATPDTKAAARDAVAAAGDERREQTLLTHVLGVQLSLAKRHQISRLMLWLVSWSIIFIWVAAIAGALYQFPETRGVANRIVSIPVLILVAGFAAGLVNGLAGILIDGVTSAWNRGDDPRRSLRVPTIAAAVKALTAAILYGVAVVAVLEYVLVIPFTVVAVGAVVALALSFAAQNFVRDLVNGLFILVEDQYALGDEIVVNGTAGVVDRLGLRITQLRTGDGRLITIPNHAIAQVENKTRRWSRVDLPVTVAYETDVDLALAVVGGVARETARDPEWQALILEPPEILGVEEISHAGIVIRVRARTPPFKKEQVARELRRRLKIAFDREGIRIGIPQQAIVVRERANDRFPDDVANRSEPEKQSQTAEAPLHS